MVDDVMFSGSSVAIVTPFLDGPDGFLSGADGGEGEVDYDAFAALVAWQIERGTSGIVVSGTTGEAATLRTEEKERLTRVALEIAAGRVPVVLGTGTNATRSSVELTRAAVEWGVQGVLVVTPYYNKPTQTGLREHFRAVAAAAAGTPVIAYDVPGRTGVTLSEETVHVLAEVPGIVALKDATHDVERAGRLARETDLTILSGDDGLTLPMLREGAKGVISVAANIIPDRMARLCSDDDIALHEELQPLFRALFVESNPIPVKWALARMGRIRNVLRLPLTPMASEHEGPLIAILRSVGVLDSPSG